MDPSVVIPSVVGIGLLYAVAPAAVVAATAARKPHLVLCPDNGQSETVRLDPVRAVRSFFGGGAQRVTSCSRWPEKAGCDRACEACLGH